MTVSRTNPAPIGRFRFRFQLAALAAVSLGLGACNTSHGVTWPAFGTYRLPYADGTTVKVSNDFETHSPIGRYDLKGQGGGPYQIVAAADGWIRFIVDSNTGHGEGDNNYVWIEHPYPYCQPAGVNWPGKPADYASTCIPCQGDTCNEWTKYSHMDTDTVTVDAGLSEGDWVTAGTFLGIESDIGHASGAHVHWEVAKLDPDHPLSNQANGWTYDWSNDGWTASPNVLPQICGIGILVDGDVHTAGPCPDTSELKLRTGIARLDWSSIWTGASVNGDPASTIGRLALSRPDARGRVTLSAVTLDPESSLVIVREGLGLPVGTELELRNVRLVRDITFELPARGYTELPSQQVVVSADVVAKVPGLKPLKFRASGPLPGKAYIAVIEPYFAVYLDVSGLGRLQGVGYLLGP